MKKYFKYLLIVVSLSFLTISNNVFAKNEEKSEGEDFTTYTVECRLKNKNYEDNEEYYENLGNLAFYSILYKIPDISKETLKNIVLSWNNGNNKQFYLNTFNIFNKDGKKIKNFYKDISEKIQKYKKKKNNEGELKKYVEKIVEEKNINLNSLKKEYKKLIKKTIKENEEEIENLKKELKKSNNNKFFINFAKKDIKEEKQKYEKRNILEEIKFKNDKKLIEDGKKRVGIKIKNITSTNKKLERNLKDTEKIKKSELDSVLKGIFKANSSLFSNEFNNIYDLTINFKNKSYNTNIINYLYSRHFFETLDKELKKQKENKYIKKSIEKTNEEFKKLIKDFKKEENLENLDIKDVKEHLKYCRGTVINPTTMKFAGRCGGYYEDSVLLYDKEKGLLEIIAKIVKSDKFKEKVKKSLTKERFKELKSELLDYIKFSNKYAKIVNENLMKKSSLDLGEKDVKKDIEWQKKTLEHFKKKQKEDKDIDRKRNIKNTEKTLKENEKKLEDKEELREIGEERKQSGIEEYKYEKNMINDFLKQLKNAKFKDMQRAKNLIKYKEIKLNRS